MLGAAAVSSTAAGGLALAETVQITQTGNKMSGPTDFAAELRADLTGDMTADLMNLYQTIINATTMQGGSYGQVDGVLAQFYSSGSATVSLGSAFRHEKFTAGGSPTFSVFAAIAGTQTAFSYSTVTTSNGLVPITFTDSRINGGSATKGMIDVKSSNTAPLEHCVEILRLVFDDSDTARPIGVTADDPDFPEWSPPVPTNGNPVAAADPDLVRKASLKRKIKGFSKKLAKARKAGNVSKARAFAKKIKKLKKQLKTL